MFSLTHYYRSTRAALFTRGCLDLAQRSPLLGEPFASATKTSRKRGLFVLGAEEQLVAVAWARM